MDRDIALGREGRDPAQEIGRAALRSAGSEHDANPVVVTVPAVELALEQGNLGVGIGAAHGGELGVDRLRNQLVRPGEARPKRLVPHVHRHPGAETRGRISLHRRVHRVRRGRRVHVVVLNGGHAGADRFDRRQHGPEIVVALRQQRKAEGRIALAEPYLERQVVVCALLEALVGVKVGIDQPRHDDRVRRVDDGSVAFPGLVPPDVDDMRALDDNVGGLVTARPCFAADDQPVLDDQRPVHSRGPQSTPAVSAERVPESSAGA